MSLVLFGYYGYGNVGDEQLLDETVRLIQELPTSFSYCVANGPISAPFPTFSRWNLLLWVKRLVSARVLIFGGGSIFQSSRRCRQITDHLLYVKNTQIPKMLYEESGKKTNAKTV